jgi:hypothetical protein
MGKEKVTRNSGWGGGTRRKGRGLRKETENGKEIIKI